MVLDGVRVTARPTRNHETVYVDLQELGGSLWGEIKSKVHGNYIPLKKIDISFSTEGHLDEVIAEHRAKRNHAHCHIQALFF
ncbi:hypothetical protein LP414_28870 [Polaromonas sp. P1(28)-13]|nr:hypothetical protein LP414_28870 [Polaromonas sp. P1(28)-13]